ncbi:MAG: DUF1700 domain-containing protein [Eubacteriales bacterium]|nr:DUF1700 domain-containing protein [Eubacteriales bacterium]
MNKREFLDTLRAQLTGSLSPTEIEGHLHYYNEYITEAVASGRTEQEVMDELGSPVFIARTLMDAAEVTADEQETTQAGYAQSDDDFVRQKHSGFRIFEIYPPVLKWVLPIALVLLLVLAISLLSSVVVLVTRFFVPIVLVILVIKLFQRHDDR